MSESKHTPGPWLCNHDAGDNYPGIPDSSPSTSDEINGNARLIAAAPDLLEW